MCNPLALIGGLAASLFSGMGGGGGGIQSYTPPEQNLTPTPPPEERTLGIDNSEGAKKQAQKGRNALVIERNHNPGVGVANGGSSGVTVPRG